jgi:hypothetical protein
VRDTTFNGKKTREIFPSVNVPRQCPFVLLCRRDGRALETGDDRVTRSGLFQRWLPSSSRR